jgi:hypothetical protein
VSTTSSLPCLLMLLADLVPELQQWAAPLLALEPKALHAWVRAGDVGPRFRTMYLLEQKEGPATFDVRDETRFGSHLRCSACGAGLFMEPGHRQLRCTSCRSVFSQDARGVWLLQNRVKVASELPDTTFVLNPDWLGSMDWVPPLHNFLRAFAATDPCRLWLQVDPKQLSADQAAGLLAPLLAPFGEDTFAELVLSDNAEEAPRGKRLVPLRKEDLSRWSAARFRECALGHGEVLPP